MPSKLKLKEIIAHENIAAILDSEDLKTIGSLVTSGFEADRESCSQWLEQTENWLNLALQYTKSKSFPWPEAANIKYPLISIAALQFNARAYPALLPNTVPVKGKVVGNDPDGSKRAMAQRIAGHMNYQLIDKMPNWEEDLDKLTIALPIVGTMFKKVCYDPLKNVPKTELLFPNDVVVNYWAREGDEWRITHLLPMSKNTVKEYQNSRLFLDVDLQRPQAGSILSEAKMESDKRIGFTESGEQNDDAPHTIIEQHCYLDLDDDGYYEPYIVTVHYASRQVLRIVARYSESDMVFNEDGDIRYINPIKYFVKYDFFPSADGAYYGRGFGSMLGHLNETANTLINQLVDAGTLSNMQSGFLARGVRLAGGEKRFRPGEWKVVNSTGDDLKKGIFPMPVREPSDVLFKLLDFIINSGKQLASVSDTMTGEMPGQNTKATTTTLVVEQGMKVFNAIYKRLYRAMGKEFIALYTLNKMYVPVDGDFAMIGPDEYGKVAKEDYYESNISVIPSADPTVDSEASATQRIQSMIQLSQAVPLNPQELAKRALHAMKEPNPEALLQMPEAPPNPEIEFKKKELEQRDRELEIKEQEAGSKAMLAEAQAMLAVAKAQVEQQNKTINEMAMQLNQLTSVIQLHHTMDMDNQNMEQQRQQTSFNNNMKQQEMQNALMQQQQSQETE